MFSKNKIMSALIISSLQANAFAANYGSYDYTLENEWESVWSNALQNEMGYAAIGVGCGETTTGDEGEEKWELPDLKHLTEIAEHEAGNVEEGTHLVLQLHGADAATTASESLFVKDIHNNTWFRLGGIAEDATFVNANGEAVREGDYAPISDKLTQGSEVKLSIIAPYSENQTEGGLLAGYNIEQLKAVLERVTPLLDAAGAIAKGIRIDILASGKKAVNPERPGSIHRKLADILTNSFKENGNDVTLRLRGKATREVTIKGEKVNQILIDGEWKADAEELFRNELRKENLSWDSQSEKYRITPSSKEYVFLLSEKMHEMILNGEVSNKAEMVNDFVDKYGSVELEDATQQERIASLIGKAIDTNISLQKLIASTKEAALNEGLQGNVLPDIKASIKEGKLIAYDVEASQRYELSADEAVLQNAKQVNEALSEKSFKGLTIDESGKVTIPDGISGVERVSTLDAAFFIKMLIDGSPIKSGVEIDPNAAKVIYYSQLVGSGLGALTQGVDFARLVTNALNYTNEVSSSVRVLAGTSKVLGTVGILTNLANIGLDIWSLVSAKNEFERKIKGATLGIDVTATLAGLGLMAFGNEATAGLGAPIAGIAMGVTALVQNYSVLQVMHDGTVKEFERVGNMLKQPYLLKDGVLKPNQNIVVKSINLNTNEVTLGSSYVAETSGGSGNVGNSWFACPNIDNSKWFDFYPALDTSSGKNLTYSLPTHDPKTPISLPWAPEVYYKGRRELAPGVLGWSGEGERVLDRIKDYSHDKFHWRFICGAEYIDEQTKITDHHVVTDTKYGRNDVNVTLNKDGSTILVPKANDSIRSYVSYELFEQGGVNNIIVNGDQSSLSLNSSSRDAKWVVDISLPLKQLLEKDVFDVEKQFDLIFNKLILDGNTLWFGGKEYARFTGVTPDKVTVTAKSYGAGPGFEGTLLSNGKKEHFSLSVLMWPMAVNRLFTQMKIYQNMIDHVVLKNDIYFLARGRTSSKMVASYPLSADGRLIGDVVITSDSIQSEKDVIQQVILNTETIGFDKKVIKKINAEYGTNIKMSYYPEAGFSTLIERGNSKGTRVGLRKNHQTVEAYFKDRVKSVDITSDGVFVSTLISYPDSKVKDVLIYKLYDDQVFRPSKFSELAQRGYMNKIKPRWKAPEYHEMLDIIGNKNKAALQEEVSIAKLSGNIDWTDFPLAKQRNGIEMDVTIKALNSEGGVTYEINEDPNKSKIKNAFLENSQDYSGTLAIMAGVATYRPIGSGSEGGIDTSGALEELSKYGVQEVVLDLSEVGDHSVVISSDHNLNPIDNIYIVGGQKAVPTLIIPRNADTYGWSMEGRNLIIASRGSENVESSAFNKLTFSGVLGSINKSKQLSLSVKFNDFEGDLSKIIKRLPMGSDLSVSQAIAGMKYPGHSDKSLVFFADGKIASLTKPGGKTALSEIKEVGSLFNVYPENRQLAASLVNLEKPNIVYLFWNDKESYGRYNTNDNGYFESTSSWVDNFHDWPKDENEEFMQVAAIVPHLTNSNYAYFFWDDGKTYGRYNWDEDKFDGTDSSAERLWSGYPKGKQVKAIIPQPNSVLATFVFEDGYTANFDFGKDEFVR
ncbi:TcdA/TcdB pore-forming domain-containing protein [Vibrio splendidus]